MCFSNTGFVIRYYGYMFVCIVFICLLNGLFLFPVMLSLIGPSNTANLSGSVKTVAISPTKEEPVAVAVTVNAAKVAPDDGDQSTPVKAFREM
jgi:hypothetical protein